MTYVSDPLVRDSAVVLTVFCVPSVSELELEKTTCGGAAIYCISTPTLVTSKPSYRSTTYVITDPPHVVTYCTDSGGYPWPTPKSTCEFYNYL